jgi:hypothetical protein
MKVSQTVLYNVIFHTELAPDLGNSSSCNKIGFLTHSHWLLSPSSLTLWFILQMVSNWSNNDLWTLPPTSLPQNWHTLWSLDKWTTLHYHLSPKMHFTFISLPLFHQTSLLLIQICCYPHQLSIQSSNSIKFPSKLVTASSFLPLLANSVFVISHSYFQKPHSIIYLHSLKPSHPLFTIPGVGFSSMYLPQQLPGGTLTTVTFIFILWTALTSERCFIE